MADIRIEDANQITRIAGNNLDGGGGVTPGTVLPVATPTGATVDDSTYDNTLTGSGKFTTLIVPVEETAILAVAVDGDDFPRWVIDANAGGGIFMGDGTADPINGANIYVSGAQLNLSGGNSEGVHIAGGTLITGALNPLSLGSTPHYVTVVHANPTTYVTPLMFDDTPVTGGLFAWNGAGYQLVAT